MSNRLNFVSSCRHCRYYSLEGRRGGYCQQLDVPVQGSWKTCSLAVSPFSRTWGDLEETVNLAPVSVGVKSGYL